MFSTLPLTTRNLILTGYGETNRPRFAREIAAQLKMTHVDLEQLLEQRLGNSADRTRQQFGGRHLKAIEAEIMSDVVLYRSAVIRINGSTLAQSEYFERIQATGTIVCLTARLDAILQRLHLAWGARYHDPAERAAALGDLKREWAIRKVAGVHEIDVTYQNEDQIIETVLQFWQQVAMGRT